jgi:hypothetical protein
VVVVVLPRGTGEDMVVVMVKSPVVVDNGVGTVGVNVNFELLRRVVVVVVS